MWNAESRSPNRLFLPAESSWTHSPLVVLDLEGFYTLKEQFRIVENSSSVTYPAADVDMSAADARLTKMVSGKVF
jgi:hypothetical protein